MPQVTLRGHIVVPYDVLQTVLRELPAHIELTRNEPGCLIFEVDRDVDNPNRFHVFEAFVDRAAFEAHQRRVARSDWGRVTARVERHYDISEDD